MRKTSDELKEIAKKYNTDRLWSWSRVHCIDNSLYEYYLKYIARVQPDRENSIYVVTGSIAHSILEDLYTNKIKYEDMLEEFEDGWTTAMIADLKFDRSDSKKNESIQNKYYADLQHFFLHHKMIPHKVEIERFITLEIEKEYFQGYIDCVFKDSEQNFNIVDFKTSSIYKGKKAEEESGQLVMYAMALNQLGVPFDKIKICWNFLKYTSIKICMKNGTTKIRQIERTQIGSSLQANVKMWLKEFGYEEQIMEYLDLLVQTNNIEVLPKDVKAKYECNDCYVYVPLSNELIQYWKDYITESVRFIRKIEKAYDSSQDEKLWWETESQVEAQSYYFANLCSYSASIHKPYAAYLERLETTKNEDNLFNINRDVIKNKSIENDIDLSWLDKI